MRWENVERQCHTIEWTEYVPSCKEQLQKNIEKKLYAIVLPTLIYITLYSNVTVFTLLSHGIHWCISIDQGHLNEYLIREYLIRL